MLVRVAYEMVPERHHEVVEPETKKKKTNILKTGIYIMLVCLAWPLKLWQDSSLYSYPTPLPLTFINLFTQSCNETNTFPKQDKLKEVKLFPPPNLTGKKSCLTGSDDTMEWSSLLWCWHWHYQLWPTSKKLVESFYWNTCYLLERNINPNSWHSYNNSERYTSKMMNRH